MIKHPESMLLVVKRGMSKPIPGHGHYQAIAQDSSPQYPWSLLRHSLRPTVSATWAVRSQAAKDHGARADPPTHQPFSRLLCELSCVPRPLSVVRLLLFGVDPFPGRETSLTSPPWLTANKSNLPESLSKNHSRYSITCAAANAVISGTTHEAGKYTEDLHFAHAEVPTDS